MTVFAPMWKHTCLNSLQDWMWVNQLQWWISAGCGFEGTSCRNHEHTRGVCRMFVNMWVEWPWKYIEALLLFKAVPTVGPPTHWHLQPISIALFGLRQCTIHVYAISGWYIGTSTEKNVPAVLFMISECSWNTYFVYACVKTYSVYSESSSCSSGTCIHGR